MRAFRRTVFPTKSLAAAGALAIILPGGTAGAQDISDIFADAATRFAPGAAERLVYADRVVAHTPGRPQPVENQRDPATALGPPDWTEPRDGRSLSLGCGGSVVLEFTRAPIIDRDGEDMFVFEVPSPESTRLEISRDGAAWHDVGTVPGGGAAMDIAPAARAAGGEAGFRMVRITDMRESCSGRTPGADIDAVAIIRDGASPAPHGVVRLSARGEEFRGWPEMRILLDGKTVAGVVVDHVDWRTYEFPLPRADSRELAVEFHNDAYDGPGRDRNLHVRDIVAAGRRLKIGDATYQRDGNSDLPGRSQMLWQGRLTFDLPRQPACSGFAGTWETTYGEASIAREGQNLIGSYQPVTDAGGTVTGDVDGRRVTGIWRDASGAGAFEWELNEDGRTFTGTWRRTAGAGNPDGDWNGECRAPAEGAPDGPAVLLDRRIYEPGERMTVQWRSPGTYDADAWVGMIPDIVPHGSETDGDAADLTWVRLGQRRAGSASFLAPQFPGTWTVRMYDGDDADSREVASAPFFVNPPSDGVLVESLVFEDHAGAELRRTLQHGEPFRVRVDYDKPPDSDNQWITLRWGGNERRIEARRSPGDDKAVFVTDLLGLQAAADDSRDPNLLAVAAGRILSAHVLEASASVDVVAPQIRIVVRPADQWRSAESVATLNTDQPFHIDVFVPREIAAGIGDTLVVEIASKAAGDTEQLRLSNDTSGTRGAIRYSHREAATTARGAAGEGKSVAVEVLPNSLANAFTDYDMGPLETEKTDTMTVSYGDASTEVKVYWSAVQQNLAAFLDLIESLRVLYNRGLREAGVSRDARVAMDRKLELIENLYALQAYEADDFTDLHRLALAEEYFGLIQSNPDDWRRPGRYPNAVLGIVQRSRDEVEAVNQAIADANERYRSNFTGFMRDLALGGYQIVADETGASQALIVITGRDALGRRVTRSDRIMAGVDLISQTALMTGLGGIAARQAREGAGGLDRFRMARTVRDEAGATNALAALDRRRTRVAGRRTVSTGAATTRPDRASTPETPPPPRSEAEIRADEAMVESRLRELGMSEDAANTNASIQIRDGRTPDEATVIAAAQRGIGLDELRQVTGLPPADIARILDDYALARGIEDPSRRARYVRNYLGEAAPDEVAALAGPEVPVNLADAGPARIRVTEPGGETVTLTPDLEDATPTEILNAFEETRTVVEPVELPDGTTPREGSTSETTIFEDGPRANDSEVETTIIDPRAFEETRTMATPVEIPGAPLATGVLDSPQARIRENAERKMSEARALAERIREEGRTPTEIEAARLHDAIKIDAYQEGLDAAVADARAANVTDAEIANALGDPALLEFQPTTGRIAALRQIEELTYQRRGFDIVPLGQSRDLVSRTTRIQSGNARPDDIATLQARIDEARAAGRDYFDDLARRGTVDFDEGFQPVLGRSAIEDLRRFARDNGLTGS